MRTGGGQGYGMQRPPLLWPSPPPHSEFLPSKAAAVAEEK